MDMETPLPGMGGEDEIEVMDGEGLDDYEQLNGQQEQTPEQAAFVESLGKIHALLTEPCQQQFALAMQGKAMDDMTEECKLEFSTAASSIPQFAKQQEAAIQQAADAARRSNGRQPDPNTGKYLAVVLVFFFVAVVGYVVYVNKKMSEMGLNGKKKNLSKKKLEKEKIKAQNRAKIQ